MKKTSAALLIFLLLSCSIPTHKFENPKQTGVDFSSGIWLLNTLDIPADKKLDFETKIMSDFSKILGNRIAYYPNIKGFLIKQKIEMKPTPATIRELKKATGYDFFINVKARELKDEPSSDSFGQNRSSSQGNISAYFEMEIYDLNSAAIVYSQKVISTSLRPERGDDVYFVKSSGELVNAAYRRLFKDLKTKSILK